MPQKVYVAVRVFNTKNVGGAVGGLEAGPPSSPRRRPTRCPPSTRTRHRRHQPPRGRRAEIRHAQLPPLRDPLPASVLKVCPEHDLAFLHVSTNQPEFKLANRNPAPRLAAPRRAPGGVQRLLPEPRRGGDPRDRRGVPSGHLAPDDHQGRHHRHRDHARQRGLLPRRQINPETPAARS